MIESAIEYAERGWLVIPLHTPNDKGRCSCHKLDCGSIGKHPRTMAGLKDATTDQEQIFKWWHMWPTANVGIVTGEVSGLVVLDIDPRHGGNESIKKLQTEYGTFQDKVFAKTGGGGWHILFAHPGVKIGNVQGTPDRPGKLGPGLDIRGDGGYIVAPPSHHASGGVYSWGVAPTVGLPDIPEWLKTILTEKRQAATIEIAEGQIPQGGRDMALTSMAGTMRRKGMGQAAILAALTEENKRCNPPMPEADILRIAKSVSRYTPDDSAVPSCEIDPNGERPDGLYYVEDFYDRIDALYEAGLLPGDSTGWPIMDEFYTVKRGQWTVITGIPSHGKSAVLDAMLVNLALNHKWRVAVCSPENLPLERHAASMMSIWARQPFRKGLNVRMDRPTKEHAKKWLNEHFIFVLPSEGNCTVQGITDRCRWLKANGNIDGVVIDPWNELEHKRPSNINESEYVAQSLSRLRRFARECEAHLWLVAHPTKLQKDQRTKTYPVPTLYDISGSAHFYNKADMGLSVWRNVLEEGTASQVHVQKVRFKECGKVGMCEIYFDSLTGQFSEHGKSKMQADISRYEAEPDLDDLDINYDF